MTNKKLRTLVLQAKTKAATFINVTCQSVAAYVLSSFLNRNERFNLLPICNYVENNKEIRENMGANSFQEKKHSSYMIFFFIFI